MGDTEGGRGFLINNRGESLGEKFQVLIHLLVNSNVRIFSEGYRRYLALCLTLLISQLFG